MHDIALFITLCGDYVTYVVYLREKLSAKSTDSIYVLYGGTQHIHNFSGLISANNTHKQDIVRVASSLCEDDPGPFRKWCDDSQNSSRIKTTIKEAW